MSRENVEAVRRTYEAFAQDDRRSHLDLFDPFVMFIPLRNFPGRLHYVGGEGIREYMRELLEVSAKFIERGEEFIEVGDSVVVSVHADGTGKESGTPTEMKYFVVWTFRGGTVIRLEAFEDRADALKAVGLRE